MSQAIERCLKDQREYSIFSPEDMIIVAESLGLTSKEQLLRERIALEKEKARMEAQSARSPQGVHTGLVIEELIMLLRGIGSCLEKKEKQDCAIPLYFRCPLSSELMLDPVILASGQTFERGFIQRWLDSGLRICPVTRQALPHINLVPNFTVKALIMNWCEEKGVSLGHSPLSNISTSEVSSYLGGECPVLGDCVQASTKMSTEEGSGCKASFLQKDDPLLYGHSRSESASSANSALDVTGRSISDEKAAATRGATVAPPYSSPWSLGTCYSSSHGEDDGVRTPSCSTGCGGWDELADYSLMERLVDDLQSREDFSSSDDREARRAAAASELRLMSKNSRENRLLIGRCGGIPPFVALLQNLGNEPGEAEGNGYYKEMEENAVTALLNLSIEETNKRAVVQAGGVEPLVQVLRYGRSAAARENAAAALASLAALEEHKTSIGRCVGVIRGLVELLGRPNGTVRGKKDAAMALFSLSIAQENKARIVQAGATRHLLEFLADGGQDEGGGGMVDKAAALLANLATIDEGRAAIVQEGGIPLLVEVVEMGSHKGKENAAAALLQLCLSSQTRCALVLEEGAVPPLITLSQLGTPRAREKVRTWYLVHSCSLSLSLSIYPSLSPLGGTGG